VRLHLRRHPAARIGDADHHVRTGVLDLGVVLHEVFVEEHVLRAHGEFAASGHGVARVHHQVHDHLLDLAWIGGHLAQIRSGLEDQLDVFANQALQHFGQIADQVVQSQWFGLQDLFAAEDQ
jgi:hypothetical protein